MWLNLEARTGLFVNQILTKVIPKVYEKLVERGVKTLEGVFSKKNIKEVM